MDLPIHTAAAASPKPCISSPSQSNNIAPIDGLPPSLIDRRPSILHKSTNVYSGSNVDQTIGTDEEYKPKVILLTGGAGFIGSHVVDHLITQHPHYRIIILDKLEYCATLNNLSEALQSSQVSFVQGDICSLDLVRHLLLSYHVDTVIHFAAQTHVDQSFGLALDFTRTNIFGTHTLLEACKALAPQIRRFIHVSTDEVYGESLLTTSERCTELSPLNPSNPYAATKVAAEYLVRSYQHSFAIPTIITRGNNVYGPRQYPEKLIPKFILLLDAGHPVPLHGDGEHRRSFLHVNDVARAFDAILHKGQTGHIYNIGSDTEINNRQVAEQLITEFNLHPAEKYIKYVRDRAYNDLRYFIDTSGLEQLGWKKQVDWKDGLQQTIEWYRHHRHHWGDIGEAVLAAHPKVDVRVAAEE